MCREWVSSEQTDEWRWQRHTHTHTIHIHIVLSSRRNKESVDIQHSLKIYCAKNRKKTLHFLDTQLLSVSAVAAAVYKCTATTACVLHFFLLENSILQSHTQLLFECLQIFSFFLLITPQKKIIHNIQNTAKTTLNPSIQRTMFG